MVQKLKDFYLYIKELECKYGPNALV